MCGNRRTLENDPRRKIQPSLSKKVACGHFFAQAVEKSDYSPRGLRPPSPQGFLDKLCKKVACGHFFAVVPML